MSTPTVGLVSPGHMGAGLGHMLARGGARAVATLDGRSPRTARLATQADLELLPDLAAVVAASDVVLVVTPPAAALDAARAIAAAAGRTGRRPLVADLNAVSPSTVAEIAGTLRGAGLDLVDGSISGAPPTTRPGARLYFSGPRAAEVAGLPWVDVTPSVLGGTVGSASALKMCTASVYKGLNALLIQALVTADRHGVLDHVLADVRASGISADPVAGVAAAATKAARFVPEMHEIAATQRAAGLTPRLFEAMAEVYAAVTEGDLARENPEQVDARAPASEIVARLVR